MAGFDGQRSLEQLESLKALSRLGWSVSVSMGDCLKLVEGE